MTFHFLRAAKKRHFGTFLVQQSQKRSKKISRLVLANDFLDAIKPPVEAPY